MADLHRGAIDDEALVAIWERLCERFGPDIAGSVCVVSLASKTVEAMDKGTDSYMFTCAFRQQSRIWKKENRERHYRNCVFGRALLKGYLAEPKDD